MFVLYGRRRVGKSTLIRKFVSDKRAVHVTGVSRIIGGTSWR